MLDSAGACCLAIGRMFLLDWPGWPLALFIRLFSVYFSFSYSFIVVLCSLCLSARPICLLLSLLSCCHSLLLQLISHSLLSSSVAVNCAHLFVLCFHGDFILRMSLLSSVLHDK